MNHSIDLLITLSLCLTFALVLGFIAQKFKFSPIVGYLLAGILVGPYTPIFTANIDVAYQFAEIGVILLMFGVGLKFHLKDLIAVKNVAVFGAITQIIFTSLAGFLFLHYFLGFSFNAGWVYGISLSVASTVVLMRILSDNKALHTPTGHTAVGWLVVEDLFTILVLVLLPAIFSNSANQNFFAVLGITLLKLLLLVFFTLYIGQKILPWILNYIAKTGTRDLFTLAVLVLALGISLGASVFFGASMALGAFLAGMVIGQSEFSARAASEALPMRDAFAVLFFVSVGMMFNPFTIKGDLSLIFLTLFIVLIIKPLIAFSVVLLMKQSLKKALSVGIVLAQIGEFSFILIALGISLKVLPEEFANPIIVAALISITINGLLFKTINPFTKFLKSKNIGNIKHSETEIVPVCNLEKDSVILVGFGPVGRTIAPIMLKNGADVIVIEMNIKTVREIHKNNITGLFAVHGDASQREILSYSGIECASALVISSAAAPAKDIVEVARSLNPKVKILIHTSYSKEAEKLKEKGVDVVFSGEKEVARSLSNYILKEMGSSNENIDLENF